VNGRKEKKRKEKKKEKKNTKYGIHETSDGTFITMK
jgi:hypothetical protein